MTSRDPLGSPPIRPTVSGFDLVKYIPGLPPQPERLLLDRSMSDSCSTTPDPVLYYEGF